MARRTTITAASVAGRVYDVESRPLRASDCKVLPVVTIDDSGKVDIIDGYHRLAGMIAAGETVLPVVDCDDAKLCGIAANAEDAESQAEALAMIYATVA
jgi:hypothetical protein